MKVMTKEQFAFPPSWCGSICRNSMSEICVTQCSLKRDCSSFQLKPGKDIIELPRFPLDQTVDMTSQEKFTIVAVYISKLVDYAKGVENEPEYKPLSRYSYRSSGSRVPSDIKGKSVQLDQSKTDTSHEDRPQRKDQEVGSDVVVGTDD